MIKSLIWPLEMAKKRKCCPPSDGESNKKLKMEVHMFREKILKKLEQPGLVKKAAFLLREIGGLKK